MILTKEEGIICPRCKGKGRVTKHSHIETMSNLELATEAHKIAFEKATFSSSLVAFLHELRGRVMRVPFLAKLMITVLLGMSLTMLSLMEYLKTEGLLTIGRISPANTVFFTTFVFSFLAGIWTVIILDKWSDKK